MTMLSGLELLVASFTRIFAASLFVASALAHGAHLPPTPVGKWKVKSVSLPVSGHQADKARAMMMTATLQIAKDKTFSMMLVQPMKGTWAVKGNEVALTITELMGRKMSEIVEMARTNYANDPSPRNKAGLDELSKPMVGTLSTDGKILTMKPAPGKAGLVFKRA